MIRELGGGVSGINVYSIEEDLVFGLKDKYRSISLVVVLCYVILQLLDSRFSFFKYSIYIVHKLSNTFHL